MDMEAYDAGNESEDPPQGGPLWPPATAPDPRSDPAVHESSTDRDDGADDPAGDGDDAVLDIGGRRAAWQSAAMCKGKTDIFFAAVGERDGRRRRREALARAYCACCSVAEECREAGRQGREHGMWGGENDEERAAAGYGPKSPHRRAVAAAAREARRREDMESATEPGAETEVA